MPAKDRWRAFVTPDEILNGDFEPMKRRMQAAGLLPKEQPLGTCETDTNKHLGIHAQTTNCQEFTPEPMRSKKRAVETEKNKVQTGNTGALSSHKALFYADISPELFRRLAKRHTVGHTKYSSDTTMDLNWREGLEDPSYIADRLNHLIDHVVCFLEDGDNQDDNLSAIAWNVEFLMEAERINIDKVNQVIGQCKYSGQRASDMRETLRLAQKKVK